MPRAAVVMLVFALLPAAAPAAQTPIPAPTSPLAGRGYVTTYATAARAVAFHPFTPRAPIGDVAIIPPFNGEGISKNEGIALAYTRGGHAWILQQWPRNAGTLAAFARLPADGDCRDVHAVGGRTKPHGVAWTTPHGMVLSLTPEGAADPGTIRAEFRRLVGLGACR